MSKKLPHNFAPIGSPFGNDTSFFKKKSNPRQNDSRAIEYRIAFVKVYEKITDKDLSLQRKYAMNLISEYLNIKPEFLRMKQHKFNEDILHTDRVYYIYKGKKLLGKCSLRERRTFKQTDLIIIFRYRRSLSSQQIYRKTERQRKHNNG